MCVKYATCEAFVWLTLWLAKKAAPKAKSQYNDYVKAKPKAPPVQEKASFDAYRPAVSEDQEKDFMSSLLGEASTVKHVPVARRTRKRKDKYDLSDDDAPARPQPSSSYGYREHMESSSDGFEMMDGNASSGDDAAWMASPRKKARTSAMTNLPPIGSLGLASDHEDPAYDQSDFSMDDLMEIETSAVPAPKNGKPAMVKKEEEDVKLPPKPLKPKNGTLKQEDEAPAWLSTYDSLNIAPNDDSIGTGAKAAGPSVSVDALEKDGSLRFFWIDYMEHEGKIYFIGKVKDKKTGAWASCCITVENLQRNLFILPRERRMEEIVVRESDDEEMSDDSDEEGESKKKARKVPTVKSVETDDIPDMKDVYNDFDQVRRKAGVKKFRAKFVDRLYAFGDKEVPREKRKWLKVVYGFDGEDLLDLITIMVLTCLLEPQIQPNTSSPNFSKIFGTSTSAFELLVIKRKIMGPCWLTIKNPHAEHKGVRGKVYQ
jgi:DNA polymerase alpha subunit A